MKYNVNNLTSTQLWTICISALKKNSSIKRSQFLWKISKFEHNPLFPHILQLKSFRLFVRSQMLRNLTMAPNEVLRKRANVGISFLPKVFFRKRESAFSFSSFFLFLFFFYHGVGNYEFTPVSHTEGDAARLWVFKL